MKKEKNVNRRDFLRNTTTAGLASVFVSTTGLAASRDPNAESVTPVTPTKPTSEHPKPEFSQVSKRKLGKIMVEPPQGPKKPLEVSILNLGGMFDIPNNQIILQKAVEWGVTYWDTAHGYGNGNSELGIGIYLKKHPKIRSELFLVSKASGAKNIKDMDSRLKTTLKRMNTDYVDLYFIHGMANSNHLTNEIKEWAREKKKQGSVRCFGFSTHKNMAKCLMGASKLNWIDAIMTTYNFRLMQDRDMQAAVEACYQAGIGLIAMKTQGPGPIKPDSLQDQKLAGHFLKQGYTEHQAKLKAVWQDKRIASICSQMPSVAILGTNVAAAIDKTKLTRADNDVLSQYAQATCSDYCAGCSHICHGAAPETPCVSEVMRYLMYYHNYGDQRRARQLFAELPRQLRDRLTKTDYHLAEAHCPQRLPIAKLMSLACRELA